ncbi:MAG: hypothetical protein MUF10_19950 [Thermoanaerobaculaceae bacterium]|nr:hypothetical protein [Thermoanaerobaculaceae bacterium]
MSAVNELRRDVHLLIESRNSHEERLDKHEARLDVLEGDREWVRTTLLRLVDSMDAVRRSTTLIAQRWERGEAEERELARAVRGLSDELRAHIDAAKGQATGSRSDEVRR